MADVSGYVAQLEQVESALRAAPGDEELIKLRADLVELVNTLSDLARVEQAGKSAAAAAFRVGDKVLALSADGEWHPARVERVTDKGYDVAFMGMLRGTKDLVAKLAAKPYERPDLSAFSAGRKVSAWYAGDRAFYRATVRGVGADTVEVEYDGFEGTETLEPECCRADEGESAARAEREGSRAGPSRPPAGGGARRGGAAPDEEDGQGGSRKRPFQIPASLEIKPDDTPEVAERKRKKIKAITRKAHAAEKDEAINEQRNSWQSFVTKKKDFTKLTRNNHDPHFDPERDHQEMARRFRGPQSAQRGEGW
ncbi:hypothetical protein KFE25_010155 [Diacronema lutheri]|uniref:Tudor domain-containing protein n=1 Tax=Diacronema lutheri TaxID=2081491 RepID=A0A8J5XIG7_DIALT|nr:hypothetical protein KFE25_010155 [Diacronema lutheri]